MRPVLWAAWFGHLEAIKVLITGGATPLCTNKVTVRGSLNVTFAISLAFQAELEKTHRMY